MFGDIGRVSAEYAVYRLLDRWLRAGCVFATSDLMAAGALRALRHSGRRVRGDVAVIGLKTRRWPGAPARSCCLRQPVEAMGERLASELLALIGRAGQGPVYVVLDTEPVIGQSAQSPGSLA